MFSIIITLDAGLSAEDRTDAAMRTPDEEFRTLDRMTLCMPLLPATPAQMTPAGHQHHGFRRWPPTRAFSRCGASLLPGLMHSYPDQTSPGTRRRAYERKETPIRASSGLSPWI